MVSQVVNSTSSKPFSKTRVTTVGATAMQLLAGENRGSVMGVTSRGIFLRVSDRQIVFLSREPFRGPLTVNVTDLPETLDGPALGSAIAVHGGSVEFQDPTLKISVTAGKRWEASPAQPPDLVENRIRRRLASIAEKVYAEKKPAGLSGLLPEFGGFTAPVDDPFSLLPTLRQARDELRSREVGRLAVTLAGGLGLGPGLTPCGDDLVLGLVLFLNRYMKWIPSAADFREFNRRLIAAASAKTTLLSANLIECAVRGQADERLVDSLDGILTGSPDSEDCAAALCSWGNSSGGDALLGMALGITATLGYK